jgi:predicted NAD-dependent protein-ADP-ribosyltransferase YbiA (DUF1768 family)
VATHLPEGAQASAHHLASWKFSEPRIWVTPHGLLGEVADEIDRLTGRPDSSERCLQAVTDLLAHPDEEHRGRLRAAYEAVPEHLRRYVLGDMDIKDQPVRVLMTPVGGDLDGRNVSARNHQQAREYFEGRDTDRRTGERRRDHEAAEELAQGPTITLSQVAYPRGWPDPPGLEALRIDYPRSITHAGQVYPSVHHAFWALSVTDPQRRREILALDNPYQARMAALAGPRVPGWAGVQVAVMADLNRAKFTQHPDLAELLMGTGDGRIVYQLVDSPFWGATGDDGRNWLGRLLELVRAELTVQRLTEPGR